MTTFTLLGLKILSRKPQKKAASVPENFHPTGENIVNSAKWSWTLFV